MKSPVFSYLMIAGALSFSAPLTLSDSESTEWPKISCDELALHLRIWAAHSCEKSYMTGYIDKIKEIIRKFGYADALCPAAETHPTETNPDGTYKSTKTKLQEIMEHYFSVITPYIRYSG